MPEMLLNYLTLAYRTLQKNTTFTIINAVGLSLSMTVFILIVQYTTFERTYNVFHKNLPVLYRVLNETRAGEVHPYTAPGFAPLATGKISGISDYCRIAEGASLGTGIVSGEQSNTGVVKSFREERFIYADANFFSFFTFPVLQGDAASLSKPNVVALSSKTRARYFGTETAVGKTVTLSNQFGQTVYTVGFVYEDMPENSDLQYDLVFSIQTLYSPANLNGNEAWASMEGTGSQWLYTYLKLDESADAENVAASYAKLIRQVNPEGEDQVVLQSVSSMHLGRSLSDPLPTFGSLRFVYLLTGIAGLILAIAWFNYVNLSTAGALRRAKEVGIRKVVGASKRQLIRQFLVESTLLNLVALVLAFAFAGALQVPYATLVGKNIASDVMGKSYFWIPVVLILLTGSVASSAYIAFLLSSFNPSKVLKGIFSKSSTGVFVRKSLVVLQFSISLILMIVTIILFQQWKYMQRKDLGMDASQLLTIRGEEVNKDETFRNRSVAFENDMASASFVQALCRSGNVPGSGFNFSTSGITRLSPTPGDEKVNYDILTIDHRYLEVYGIRLVSGENFTAAMCSKPWNEMEYVILNERASSALGFRSAEDAVGQKVKWSDREFVVRGVLQDYHHLPVQYAIGPIIFLPSQDGGHYTLKVAAHDFVADIPKLEKAYLKSFPGNPFEFRFLDDSFAAKYAAEQRYSIVFTLASSLAIFIGSLGLFGLAAFSVEQRTKEIGIRKILGSSVYQIVGHFSKDFLVLIVIAFALAVPVSWWLMDYWLQGFAYHVAIEWWVFALSGAITICIAWVTVGSQALRGAVGNPVNALRHE